MVSDLLESRCSLEGRESGKVQTITAENVYSAVFQAVTIVTGNCNDDMDNSRTLFLKGSRSVPTCQVRSVNTHAHTVCLFVSPLLSCLSLVCGHCCFSHAHSPVIRPALQSRKCGGKGGGG